MTVAVAVAVVVLALGATPGLAATAASAESARAPGACAQDEPVAPPHGWQGWDRSSSVAWEAIEQVGGVVPEIEEDRAQAPPAWWRYPSARHSLALLEVESGNAASGLYGAVEPRQLASGDIVLRTTGPVVGACGKMALVSGNDEGKWTTVEVGADGREPTHRTGSPWFFADDGKTPLPGTQVFRIRVKKEDTLGHIRELRRDLDHLERTVGDRTPLLASGDDAAEVVAEKIHELVDEAWSLVAEEAYDVDRRELAARALVLGAALGWPGAAESARALLDDVLARAPARANALAARATLAQLAGDPARSLADARVAIGLAPLQPRPRWLEVRALQGMGRQAEATEALRRFRIMDPRDVRASRLEAQWRAAPAKDAAPLAKAGAAAGSGDTVGAMATAGEGSAVRYFATPEKTGLESADLAFRISWPLTWRVSQVAAGPETGVLASLSTGRVLLDDGQADRASAVILAQRPAGAAARAALLRSGVRRMFPAAKLKPLVPLLPGSRRAQFLDRPAEGARAGEVVTMEKGGVVFFLVLNAPAEVYPKLRDEYESFVRSLVVVDKTGAPTPGAPSVPPRFR